MFLSLGMTKSLMYKVGWDFSGDINSSIFYDILNRFMSNEKHGNKISVARVCSNIDFDIIHYHRVHKASMLSDSVNIATIHHDISDESIVPLNNDYLYLLSKLDKIICLSSVQERFIKRKLNLSTPVDIIPHGYDPRLILSRDRKNNYSRFRRKVNVAIISKRYNNKQKGENFLFEIFNRLDPNHYNLILVGEGRRNDLNKFSKLGFNVTCIEPLHYEDLISLYALIDIVLITSKTEGGPACLPEALAAGCSLVSRNVGFASDFKHPKLYLSNDVEGFVSGIISCREEVFICNLSDLKKSNLKTWDDIIALHCESYISLLR